MKFPTQKMNVSRLFRGLSFIFLCVPLWSACIQSESPLSTEKFQDDSLVGHWSSAENSKSVMDLDISRAADGSYNIEERDRNEAKSAHYVATLTHGKRTNYLSLAMPRDRQSDAYMLFQYNVDPTGKLHAWSTAFDKLKADMSAKKISGNNNETTWGQNMLITTPGAQLLNLFDATNGAEYFSDELVFVRGQSTVNAVTKTLQAQADAWNAGDLNKFMTAYLKSPDISFVSSDGELKGYDALDARYRKKYGSSPETMGKLSFTGLEIQNLGDKNALCIGKWLVVKPDQTSLHGMFSLVLTLSDGEWKIIHDHTSLAY